VAVPVGMPSPLTHLALPQHADQHRPERPVLLAVDQELDYLVFLTADADALPSISILFDIDVR
jgi:hypothetical protein